MKVLNLQCAFQHSFEGWFGSEADFANQLAQGLVSCPLCGDVAVQKMLSAPRLNLRSGRGDGPVDGRSNPPQATPDAASRVDPAPAPDVQARLMQALRAVLANTEDVGDRFADQARAMHHGDAAPRSIRGQTTPEVALELIEEGIEVMPLPQLPALKETLQ